MARLNIDDKLFKDNRYYELANKIGRQEALGALVAVWVVAQDYWKNDKSLIPKEEWDKQALNNEVIKCGLARVLKHGIYACGSEEQFAWLVQRSENGRKLSENKLKQLENARKSKTQRKQTLSSERELNGTERELNKSEPPTPTPTPTPTLSHTLALPLTLAPTKEEQKEEELRTGSKQVKPVGPNPLNLKVWDAYKTDYLKKYGVEPVRNQSVNSIVANLVKRLGEDAIEVVKFYLSHNKSFYVEKSHQLRFCLMDAETLHTQWRRGFKITDSKMKDFRRAQENEEIIEAIKRREI